MYNTVDQSDDIRERVSRHREEQQRASVLEAAEVDALFREYHPRVYNYVRYRISDQAEAEDLTSEIVERALTYLASYDPDKGAFSTWLFRIAHNTLVNYFRRRTRRSQYLTALDDVAYELTAEGPTPEEAMMRDQDTARLLACLGTLRPRQQEILALRFAGRLKNREIARVLKMNERTVSVTILRALRKLRHQLVEEEK